ncbi:MAG: DUF4116 domain-containing protein [Parachlamydiaceae bacterium]|nr:DUF4116 domain-containing protein [Parachlamydiaceae bacterium]
MSTINNDTGIRTLDSFFPNNSVSRYLSVLTLKQETQERVKELCKLIFYSILTLFTIGSLKESRLLSAFSWNRIWLNPHKYNKSVKPDFIAHDNFETIVETLLEDNVQIFEIIHKVEKHDFDIPERTTQTFETQLAKIIPQKNTSPLFDFIEFFGKTFSNYLDKNDKSALLRTSKLIHDQYQIQILDEVKPLIEYIQKITGIIENASPNSFKAAILRDKLLNSNYLKNPFVDFNKKNEQVRRLLFNAFNDIFTNNEDLKKNKDIFLLMASVDLGDFIDVNILDRLQYFLNDEEMMRAAIKIRPKLYEHLTKEFKLNKKIILEAVNSDPNMMEVILLEENNTLDDNDRFSIYLAVVSKDGMALQYIPEKINNAKDIVLAAVKQNGLALEFADEFFDDEEIALKAVETNGMALQYVSDRIKALKYIALAAVNQNGMAIKFVNGDLIKDLEIVKTAITSNGLAIELISPDYWVDDDELAFNAIKNNAYCLAHLNLNDEFEFAIEAVKQNVDVYEILGDELLKNIEITSKVFSKNGLMLKYAPEEILNNKSIVLIAVTNNGLALEFTFESLQNDFDVALAAVTNDGQALEFVSEQLKKDPQICMAAINNNGDAYTYIDSSLHNEEFLLKALRTSKSKKTSVEIELTVTVFSMNKKVIFEAVKFDGLLFKLASNSLKNEVEIVLNAVKNNGLVLEFVTEEIEGYKAIAIEALRQNAEAINYIPKHLQDVEILKEHEQSLFIHSIFPKNFGMMSHEEIL